MDFNSIMDAELLFQDMVCGNVHLAHEVSIFWFSHRLACHAKSRMNDFQATVGAIGLLCNNSRLYCAKLFLISGSCKKETAEDHASLIQTALVTIQRIMAGLNLSCSWIECACHGTISECLLYGYD